MFSVFCSIPIPEAVKHQSHIKTTHTSAYIKIDACLSDSGSPALQQTLQAEGHTRHSAARLLSYRKLPCPCVCAACGLLRSHPSRLHLHLQDGLGRGRRQAPVRHAAAAAGGCTRHSCVGGEAAAVQHHVLLHPTQHVLAQGRWDDGSEAPGFALLAATALLLLAQLPPRCRDDDLVAQL